jgi:hypothetical protein
VPAPTDGEWVGRQAGAQRTTRHTYAWTSKIVYSKLPLYAGFFDAPEALGAKVVAAFLANLDTCRDKQGLFSTL